MKIKKREAKKFVASFKKNLSKLNWLYIAIIGMTLLGVGLLIVSCWITDSDLKNIAVGLGTGVVTSAMVTLYIDLINSRLERKKLARYKKMLLNPLYNAIKSLYVHATLVYNEYRIREEKRDSILLPVEDTKELSDFFDKMKNIDMQSIDDEKKKKRLEEFTSVSPVYYREVISQYEGLPFESLILDNIITQEEYDKLKHFTLLNESKKCLGLLNDKNLSEKERYYTSVQLFHCMMLFINNLMKIFDFISFRIEEENEWINQHLNDLYYNEVYAFSDEYIEQLAERAEAEAEYYAEYLELLEEVEESEEQQLYRKINTAIWAGDAKTIKECFPKIDKDDKQIQSELTWSLAKEVMKDKELRELYYQKYGMKYKVRKEKRRRK